MAELERLLSKVENRPMSESRKRDLWKAIAADTAGVVRDEASRAPSNVARLPTAAPYLALAATAAVVLLAIGLSVGSSTEPPTLPLTQTLATAEAPRALVLLDGHALGPELERIGVAVEAVEIGLSDRSTLFIDEGAHLELIQSTGEEVSWLLRSGRVTFHVEPGGPRRWTIDAGLATVDVVGTRFTVARQPERVRVDVERGAVRVHGEHVPELAQLLAGGDSLVVRGSPVEGPLDLQAIGDEAVGQEAANEALPVSRRRRSWRRLAANRDHTGAYQALGEAGIARESERADEPSTLLMLADVARLSGHPRAAVLPLSRVVDEHSADPRAPAAAFTMGQLCLDTFDEPRQAAQYFEQTIALGAPRGLQEDARHRLVQARYRAGDRAGARVAAEEYLSAFPEGRHAEAVLGLLVGRD